MTESELKRRIVLRSLFVQGSWNYRTLLGAGVGWALLPLVAPEGRGRSSDGGGRGPDVARLAASFNAHPYLTPVAIGALAKVEREGADPERIRRFRDALRGPLGSLGDGLVWGAWRPLCLLAAVAVVALGVPPTVGVVAFLVAYNWVHLALRWWGAGVGLRHGFGVGDGIREVDLPGWTERAGRAGVLLLGVVGGALVARVPGPTGAGLVLAGAAALAGVLGFVGGESGQRWGPLGAFLLVGAGLAVGASS